MANPNIPNLCGANPNLNGMLSEIDKLKDKLLSSIDVDASELKADLETSLGDLKAAFDKLEIELPAAPNVNFQAEVTSLINDIDKTNKEKVMHKKYFKKLENFIPNYFNDFIL